MEQTEGELESRLPEITDYSKKGLGLSRKLIKSDYQKNLEERGWELITRVYTEEALRDYVEDKKILEYLIEGCEIKSDKDHEVKVGDILRASAKDKKSIYRKIFRLYREECKKYYTRKKVKLARAHNNYGERIDSKEDPPIIDIYIKDR